MEKRNHPRVSLMAEVTFQVDGVGMTKRVTDLSEGGLFIESPVTVPVGTEMKIRFVLDGQPVLAEGRVAYTQPFLGMGVEITAMSELSRLAIRDYVAGLVRADEPAGAPV